MNFQRSITSESFDFYKSIKSDAQKKVYKGANKQADTSGVRSGRSNTVTTKTKDCQLPYNHFISFHYLNGIDILS